MNTGNERNKMRFIKRLNTIFLYIFVGTIILSCNESPERKSLQQPTAVKSQNEFQANELPDIWHRKSHPRVLLDKEQLQVVVNRMYGDNAREPYSRWFNLIKNSEDNGTPVDLVNLALIYRATNNSLYKQRFLDRLPNKGVPNLVELYAIDIMFDYLSIEVKTNIMVRVAESKTPWYSTSIKESKGEKKAKWGYHDAIRVAPAFAYAAIFADTDLEKFKDKKAFPFDSKNYLKVVDYQLSPDGYFWKIENRIAGDTTYNDALPGSSGGMYDNIGYDEAEESYSINLLLQHHVLTGERRFEKALHDKFRAVFYQNMEVPYTFKKYPNNAYCRKAGTHTNLSAQVWNTQTSNITQPQKNSTAVTAFLYQDPKMQHYVINGKQRELCRPPYNGMFWELIYFDDTLSTSPSSDNPTAMYFSGPGIVTMRSDWTKDATYSAFLAGEGIGRRYEDANSFLISRKTSVIPHAGARIRFNKDNMKHFWYHIRSASKNTLKIFDPEESFDIKADGATGQLHSGTKLVDSDNLGGQIFEISPSNKNGCYNTYMQCSSRLKRNGKAFPLGIYETANITKFEHVENDYTYTVGDASAAYTKKVDYFEREFVFIRPDSFVIFDRVKSTTPDLRKVWTIHTNDQPVIHQPENSSNLGMKSYRNANNTIIKNPVNYTYIDTLLPIRNKITIRGGDSTIIHQKRLSDIPKTILDIPRWLEVFIVGQDVVGSLVINGTNENGLESREVVKFDGKVRIYHSGKPTSITSHSLADSSSDWTKNQWQGYQVTYKYNKVIYKTIITGNSKNMLFGDFEAVNSYNYKIERTFANTYLHWKSIKTISSQDMKISNITVTVPHYFDTKDASGKLHSFAPHTDFKDDQYRLTSKIGRWNMNVEATVPSMLDHFAHVISLKDPTSPKPKTAIIEGGNTYGVIVNQYLVVFPKEQEKIKNLTLNVPLHITNILLTNLLSKHKYHYKIERINSNYRLTINFEVKNSNTNLTKTAESSSMGLLKLNVD